MSSNQDLATKWSSNRFAKWRFSGGRQLLHANWPYVVFFALVLVISFNFSIRGWSFSIGGPQDFRQTQTAIATYYAAEEGLSLSTKIPVLGPHWYVPFEFPTYQSIVATVHRITGWPLESTGRGVSLLAFYLGLIPAGIVLRRLGFPTPQIFLTLALVASCPTYIFWSRTFLIESFSWALAMSFTAGFLTLLEKSDKSLGSDKQAWSTRRFSVVYGLTLAIGYLAAVTKFTTFSVFLGFLILLIFCRTFTGLKPSLAVSRTRIFGLAVLLFSPVLVGYLWTLYLNSVWALSPLTEGMVGAINKWNFGTLKLRMQPDFWGRFHLHAIHFPTGSILPWLIGFTAFSFATFRWRVIGLCAFGAWLAGPLVWANLYLVHDYYYVASMTFGFIWMAAAAQGISDRWPALLILQRASLAILAICLLVYYSTMHYFDATSHDWGKYKAEFSTELRQHVPEEDVLIIIGDDWNPMISYYSRRYSIMVRWEGHSFGEDFRSAVELTRREGRRFAGIVVTAINPLPNDLENIRSWLPVADQPAVTSADQVLSFYPAIE